MVTNDKKNSPLNINTFHFIQNASKQTSKVIEITRESMTDDKVHSFQGNGSLERVSRGGEGTEIRGWVNFSQSEF